MKLKQSHDGRVVIITGCSSGFGYHSALLFAKRGWHVCATMRDLSRQDQLTMAAREENLSLVVKRIDVKNDASIRRSVAELDSEKGRIDVLINNAGYGLIGAVEDLDMDQIKEQFETNFFGCVRMINAVMPIFRRQRQGQIINVTSVAGLVGMPLYSAYCASKYALEGLSEAMRFEAQLYNISINNVEPGSFATQFSGISMVYGARTKSALSPYKKINDYFFSRTINTKFSPPQEVADLMVRIAEKRSAKLWNPIGLKVRELVLFKRYLGVNITQKIIKHLMKVPD